MLVLFGEQAHLAWLKGVTMPVLDFKLTKGSSKTIMSVRGKNFNFELQLKPEQELWPLEGTMWETTGLVMSGGGIRRLEETLRFDSWSLSIYNHTTGFYTVQIISTHLTLFFAPCACVQFSSRTHIPQKETPHQLAWQRQHKVLSLPPATAQYTATHPAAILNWFL